MNPSDQETTRGPIRHPGGTPREAERPYLLGIAGEHAGRLFPLDGLREVFIGRGPDCEISCQLDTVISRRHAHITLDDAGRAWIEDLESLNGTLVNGTDVVRPTMLRRGDRVYVGEASIFKLDWLTADEVEHWQSATVDALTECLNRGMFQSRLDDMFGLARMRQWPLSLLLLDVDHFKVINDDHGHQVGDYVLQRVAATIKTALAESSGELPAYRYGGEEFAVLVPESPIDRARELAEVVRRRVESASLAYQDLRLSVTVSIGVASMIPDEIDMPHVLIRHADERLYRAKHEGRNRVIA